MQIPIGVFDSGYGGLTVLREITKRFPSMIISISATMQERLMAIVLLKQCIIIHGSALQWFFKQNCPLIILACNTASAKALRTIQQNDLHKKFPVKKC